MFKNYLKIAIRNLIRNKIYSTINVLGLAIGIACCILIFLFVANELSYDSFHQNADKIYRVYVTEDLPERDPFSYSFTPAQMAGAMEQSFPEVVRAVRFESRTDNIRVGENSFSEQYSLADPDFFELFDFPLLQGNPQMALADLNSVVLTEEIADKFFGRTDVVGRLLSIKLGDKFHDFAVTAVAKNIPENSSVTFDLLIPWENARKFRSERQLNNWFNVFMETYVQMAERLDAVAIEEKLDTVVKNHYPERAHSMVTLHLQPLLDIHLNPYIPAGIQPTSDPVYSYILIGIAVLILGVACINFMTLAVGRSATRAKEVGVRKVLGAVRVQLAKQFWGEALLMSFVALFLGVLLAALFLPIFNELANKELFLSADFLTLFVLAALMLLVGLIAGSYPALVLSRLQPVVIIKCESQAGGRRLFGGSLVVLQFALSVFLIVSTLIMADQLHYLRTKNLGFNKEQVIVIPNNAAQAESKMVVDRFRNALGNRSQVLGVSGASSRFSSGWTTMGFNDENGSFKQFYQLTVDYDYLESLGMELVSGRNFSHDFGTDSSQAIIVNEALTKYFDWEAPIGKRMPGRSFAEHQVIGVVKDFNFQSLQSEIAPLALTLDPSTLFQGINDISTSSSPRQLNFIHVRITPEDIPGTINLLKETWERVISNQPFDFSFLDQDVQRQYQQEERWGKIVAYASAFAVFIACLGLFGLATLAVARRTKEIGIRKVLGASVPKIILMLSNDFGKLVLIATVIAWPLAYLGMQEWLKDFAYRISIGAENFLIATMLAIAIAVLSVSFQSVRAAMANPVEAIKYE